MPGLDSLLLKVSRAIFGGPPVELCYASIRTVPMGWINAVELIQNCIRNFSFKVCGIPANWEVRGDRHFPPVDAAVICMDGLDIFSRDKLEEGVIRQVSGFFPRIRLVVRRSWATLLKNAKRAVASQRWQVRPPEFF